jgi:hypothetical protein
MLKISNSLLFKKENYKKAENYFRNLKRTISKGWGNLEVSCDKP